jgi:hypothetical protein
LVSKIRVALGMLVLAALAIGATLLLLAMDADPTWFKFVPTGIIGGGATVAYSAGWFNKKGR